MMHCVSLWHPQRPKSITGKKVPQNVPAANLPSGLPTIGEEQLTSQLGKGESRFTPWGSSRRQVSGEQGQRGWTRGEERSAMAAGWGRRCRHQEDVEEEHVVALLVCALAKAGDLLRHEVLEDGLRDHARQQVANSRAECLA